MAGTMHTANRHPTAKPTARAVARAVAPLAASTSAAVRVLFMAAAAALGVAASGPCTTWSDCYLNGVCTPRGVCACNPGWVGAHCGMLDLLPTRPGPLGNKAFPPGRNSSCWGSSVVKGRDGR